MAFAAGPPWDAVTVELPEHAIGMHGDEEAAKRAAYEAIGFLAHARVDAEWALAELDAVRARLDALLDAAREVLDEAAEHAGCVPRSGCAYAVLRAAVEACAPKEGT